MLLLDVRMPRMDGVQVIANLASQAALPPTLLLTTFEDDAALIGGIRAGARGFLLKGVTPETLIEAIHTVAKGGTFLHTSLTSSGVVPNTQIAEALDLGEGTVRNHVSSILSKLGVADRTKAVLLALQQRLV